MLITLCPPSLAYAQGGPGTTPFAGKISGTFTVDFFLIDGNNYLHPGSTHGFSGDIGNDGTFNLLTPEEWKLFYPNPGVVDAAGYVNIAVKEGTKVKFNGDEWIVLTGTSVSGRLFFTDPPDDTDVSSVDGIWHIHAFYDAIDTEGNKVRHTLSAHGTWMADSLAPN